MTAVALAAASTRCSGDEAHEFWAVSWDSYNASMALSNRNLVPMVRLEVELYYRTANYNLTKEVQQAIAALTNDTEMYIPGRRPVFSG